MIPWSLDVARMIKKPITFWFDKFPGKSISPLFFLARLWLDQVDLSCMLNWILEHLIPHWGIHHRLCYSHWWAELTQGAYRVGPTPSLPAQHRPERRVVWAELSLILWMPDPKPTRAFGSRLFVGPGLLLGPRRHWYFLFSSIKKSDLKKQAQDVFMPSKLIESHLLNSKI